MLSLAAIAYIIASGNLFRSKKGILWFFMLMGLAIFPASQMGFRGLMLLPIVQIMFIYHHRVRQLKFRKALPVLLILVFLFTGYGIYRESIFLMKDGFDLDLAMNFIEEHPEFIYAIFVRSKGADIVASVIHQFNGVVDYILFIPAAIEAFTIAIPSALWADKPIPLSVKFSERFFGISGGVSPTVVGEAYWHGGVLGILLVMALLGAIFRLYRNSVRRAVNTDSSVFLFASIFPSLVMMAEAVQGYLNGIVLMLLVGTMLIVAFSTTKRYGGRGGDSRINC